jgi:hypothetical protein
MSPLSAPGPVSSGDVFVKNQITYTVGLEFDVSPRATAVVDLVGRRLQKGGRAGYRTFTGVFGPGGSLEALVPLPEGLNVVSPSRSRTTVFEHTSFLSSGLTGHSRLEACGLRQVLGAGARRLCPRRR